VGEVPVTVFPQPDECKPVFRLVLLYADPFIICAKIGVIRELERGRLILEMHRPMQIVRGGIDQVAKYHLDRSVLFIFRSLKYSLVNGQKFRFPLIDQGTYLFAQLLKFGHDHPPSVIGCSGCFRVLYVFGAGM
jgi:hypothetical protein